MSEFVNTIDALGDETVLLSIIDRTITEFKDDVITIFPKGYVFAYCESLETVDCPNVTRIGQGGDTSTSQLFAYCTSLKNVNLPNVVNIVGNATFYKCSSLEIIYLPKCTGLSNQSIFSNCSNLKAVVLGSDSICKLSYKNVFQNTPIASGTGYIYVPRAFLSDTDSTMDYRQTGYWSTYTNQFRVLEDYTVDGTITGELDPNKI